MFQMNGLLLGMVVYHRSWQSASLIKLFQAADYVVHRRPWKKYQTLLFTTTPNTYFVVFLPQLAFETGRACGHC